MKIALAQINLTVGALEANCARALDAWRRAARLGADLVVFPELTVMGYPPKDLVELPAFIEANVKALHGLAEQMVTAPGVGKAPGAIVGFVQPNAGPEGKGLYNAAALIDEGKIVSQHYKTLLPTYDVFDEGRHFEPAPELQVAVFRGRRIALTICEDFWNNDIHAPRRLYHRDPIEELAARGVDLIINISASPYSLGKRRVRAKIYGDAARRWKLPLVQVNLVGGNDNLIFDGWSNVWDTRGRIAAQAALFEEDLVLWEEDSTTPSTAPRIEEGEEDLYRALTLGIRDYFGKCGFRRALIGLSGGIDSALTAVLAADALGAENVVGVAMPSRFSSSHSLDDARALARNLKIELREIEIEPLVEAYTAQLAPHFAGTAAGVAEENIQSRVRGNLLMALSNKFGWLVLSTGNKSELATGYCTLYGDMSGGLAVLADVLKTEVYALSNWINRERERIPTSSITKPPSAELREGQKDSDSLPLYDVLDPIIAAYVEEQVAAEAIIARGFDEALVRRVLGMIDRAEYKRQQAPPGLKITQKAFGSGRRMPIARGEWRA